ncbi:hypothetical protein EMIT0P74_30327 [Pseudomonas sp. IT-P74]
MLRKPRLLLIKIYGYNAKFYVRNALEV